MSTLSKKSFIEKGLLLLANRLAIGREPSYTPTLNE
jgi:hypothetical protein